MPDEKLPQPVDLRGLQPPEPMVRILGCIEAPGDGPYVFVLPHEPFPLYPMLRAQGWRHRARVVDQGVEITVERVRAA